MWKTVFTDETDTVLTGMQPLNKLKEKNYEQFNNLQNKFDYSVTNKNKEIPKKEDNLIKNTLKGENINKDTLRGCSKNPQINILNKYNYQQYNQNENGFIFLMISNTIKILTIKINF